MTELSTKDRVRLLTSDVGGESGEDFIFTDDEVNTFLDMSDDDIYAAAASALLAMAVNEAIVQKRIEYLGLKTDGPAVAKDLRETAKRYADMAGEDAEFEIADMNVTHFGERDLRLRYAQRYE